MVASDLEDFCIQSLSTTTLRMNFSLLEVLSKIRGPEMRRTLGLGLYKVIKDFARVLIVDSEDKFI